MPEAEIFRAIYGDEWLPSGASALVWSRLVGIFTLAVTENDTRAPIAARIWIGPYSTSSQTAAICISCNLTCETVDQARDWLESEASRIAREMIEMAGPMVAERVIERTESAVTAERIPVVFVEDK